MRPTLVTLSNVLVLGPIWPINAYENLRNAVYTVLALISLIAQKMTIKVTSVRFTSRSNITKSVWSVTVFCYTDSKGRHSYNEREINFLLTKHAVHKNSLVILHIIYQMVFFFNKPITIFDEFIK